jgi:hypothetical protein
MFICASLCSRGCQITMKLSTFATIFTGAMLASAQHFYMGQASCSILGCDPRNQDCVIYVTKVFPYFDKDNCGAITNSRSEGQSDGAGFPNEQSVQRAPCGIPFQLDFYKNSAGKYDFYQHNGNGTALGQCYPDSWTRTCTTSGALCTFSRSMACGVNANYKGPFTC